MTGHEQKFYRDITSIRNTLSELANHIKTTAKNDLSTTELSMLINLIDTHQKSTELDSISQNALEVLRSKLILQYENITLHG